MKRQGFLLLAAAMTATWCLAGCKSSTGTEPSGKEAAATEAGTEKGENESETRIPDTLEESSSAETEEKTRILVVSFGTSFNHSRDITIGAVEKAIADAYPQYEVKRAFTAQIVIDILKKRDGLEIDNMTEALDRAVAEGVRRLVVQPTHLMDGLEYQDVMAELEEYQEDFDQILVGKPLLSDDRDFEAVAKAITDATSSWDDGETAIVYMGHGTEAGSNQIYERFQRVLKEKGFEHYYIGTVEAEPTLDEVRKELGDRGGYKRVVLAPLMVVAGDHANNDMAGDGEDSWKNILAADGYEVECLLQGLGELEAIRQIYVDHVNAALEGLK